MQPQQPYKPSPLTFKKVERSLSFSDNIYFGPANSLQTICSCILDTQTYSITQQKHYQKSDSLIKFNKLEFISINITPCEVGLKLSDEQRGEILLKLIDELTAILGQEIFNALIESHAFSEDGKSYRIMLNVKRLHDHGSMLRKLESAMRHETQEQKENREQDFKIRLEAERVAHLESKFGQIGSQEALAELTLLYNASTVRLTELKGQRELHRIFSSDLLNIPNQVRVNIKAMFLLYLGCKQAIESDLEFQRAILCKFKVDQDNPVPIKKIMEDPGHRLDGFILYVDRNLAHQKKLRTIFNNICPQENKKTLNEYLEHAAGIEQHTKENEAMLLSGEIDNALRQCHAYIDAQENQYYKPASYFVDACNFFLRYPHLNFEPQFEQYDPTTNTIGGSLLSIKVEVTLCNEGTIRNKADFDRFLDKLTELLGKEKFSKLVTIEMVTSLPEDATKYYLDLNPLELQTITSEDLITDLSEDDLFMYKKMQPQIISSNANRVKLDPIDQMYKDFVALYEIYAQFKLLTDSKVAFTKDPTFLPGQTSDKSVQAKFIEFIVRNQYYLNTVTQIFFNEKSHEETLKKSKKYLSTCETASNAKHGKELEKIWYSSFAELIKVCALLAQQVHYLPKLRPFFDFCKEMDIPGDVIYFIFDIVNRLKDAEKELTHNVSKSHS